MAGSCRLQQTAAGEKQLFVEPTKMGATHRVVMAEHLVSDLFLIDYVVFNYCSRLNFDCATLN